MDYVRTPQNTFALMELELIEPSLYFNMDSASPERFANVFEERMNAKLSGWYQYKKGHTAKAVWPHEKVEDSILL